MKKVSEKKLIAKPPVVVIMGHVDHGKTTLVDYIRKSRVAEKESGGITQAIGAYEIDNDGKKITFIDTPGHEAFSQIRSRGSKAADIAVLIVATDDGVMPQTKEAIEHIKLAKIPFIVALNKTDRPNSQPDRVKTQLADTGIYLEGWGGDVPSVLISAKTGAGVKELLDLIILLADVNDLQSDITQKASGVILESKRDSKKGLILTCLVNEGIIKTGNYLVIDGYVSKIKFMENFLGKIINEAYPSMPVLIYGFDSVKTKVGDIWEGFETIEEAEQAAASHKKENNKIAEINYGDKKILDIVLKADVYGSLEAIESIISGFNFIGAATRIIKSGVGDINEDDLKTAKNNNIKIYGFKVKFLPSAENISKMINAEVLFFQVIYELIDKIKSDMAKLLPPEIVRTDLGEIQVLATFGKTNEGMIVGGRVKNGSIKKSAKADIFHGGKLIGKGVAVGLKYNKDEREEIKEGNECGVNLSSNVKVEVGDLLKFYTEEAKVRKLE